MSTPIRVSVILETRGTKENFSRVVNDAISGALGANPNVDRVIGQYWTRFGAMGRQVIRDIHAEMASTLNDIASRAFRATSRATQGSTGGGSRNFSAFGPSAASFTRYQWNLLGQSDGTDARRTSEMGAQLRARADEWARMFAAQDRAIIERAARELESAQSAMRAELSRAASRAVESDKLSNQQYKQVTSDVGTGIRSRAMEWANVFAVKDKQNANAARELAEHQAEQAEKTAAAFRRINVVGGQIAGKVLSAPFDFFQSIGNEAMRISAIIYSFTRLGRLAYGATISPIENIVGASEQSRKFQMSIAGVVGGMGNARGIDNAIIGGLGNVPYTLGEARNAAQIASRVAGISSSFGFASPTEAGNQVQSLSELIARFQVGNPDKTGQEIAMVIQRVLEGNPRSIRDLGIDPRDLQGQLQMTQKEVAGNQQAILSALQVVARERVPNSVMNARMTEPSFLVERIKDLFTIAMQRVGDAGLYDEVGQKLQTVFTHIFDYIQSSQFMSRAEEMGQSITKIFDAIGLSMLKLVQAASGSKSAANTPDQIASQVVGMLNGFQQFAQDLPGYSKIIGENLNEIGTFISWLAHKAGAVKYVSEYSAEENEQRNRLGVQRMKELGLGDVEAKVWQEMENRISPMPPSMPGANPVFQPTLVDKYGIQLPPYTDPLTRNFAQNVKGGVEQMTIGEVSDPDIFRYRMRRLIPGFDDLLATATSSDPGAAKDMLALRNQGVFSRYNALGIPDIMSGNMYTAKAMGMDHSIEQLRELMPQTAEKWEETLRMASDSLGNILDGDIPAKMKKLQMGQFKQLMDFVSSLMDGSAGNLRGEAAGKVSDMISSALAAANKTMDDLPVAVKRLIDRINESGQRGAFAYVDALKGEDVSVRIRARGDALAGRLGLQRGLSGGIPTDLLDRETKIQIQDQLADILQQGKYDNRAQFGSFLFGAGTSDQQLGMLQYWMPILQQRYGKALTAFANNPSPENSTNLDIQAAMIAKYKGQMTELERETNRAGQAFIDFGNAAQNSLENSLGNSLAGLLEGTKNLADVWKSLARQIISDFSQISVKLAFNSVLGDPSKTGSSGAGGIIGLVSKLIPGLGGLGGGSAPNLDSYPSGANSVWSVSAANGAVWVPSFARGGIARTPTILVGDNSRFPELVAPMSGPGGTVPLGVDHMGPHVLLPGNRRIAATFLGGMTSYASGGIVGSAPNISGAGLSLNHHTVIVDNRQQAEAEASAITARDRQAIVHIIAADLLSGGVSAAAMRRAGGR